MRIVELFIQMKSHSYVPTVTSSSEIVEHCVDIVELFTMVKFRLKNQWKLDRRIHTGENPFVCPNVKKTLAETSDEQLVNTTLML